MERSLKIIGTGLLFGLLLVVSCGPADDIGDENIGEISQAVISQSAANALINYGRSQIGSYGGQCKLWVQNTVSASYGVLIAQNDTSHLYKWKNDYTPARNVARWLGSYANSRNIINSISGHSTVYPSTMAVSNNDPQVIIIYADSTNVTATMTKGSSSLSVSSSGKSTGTVSSSTATGCGFWGISVTNNNSFTVSNIRVVVLSRSRFKSDWETARRGDIIQMYSGGHHTTFVQTNYNANGTCNSSDSTGCNWLDSNYVPPYGGIVAAHNVSMNDMMKKVAKDYTYGFTIYRLN